MALEKKDWTLTKASFDKLLDWLDKDREEAGNKYEQIRLTLIKIFVCRGCSCPEELADETINRVAGKLTEIVSSYVGNPALYFSSVARLIYLEYSRRENTVSLPPNITEIKSETNSKQYNNEPEYECLEQCLDTLPTQSRELILTYYSEEKRAKIDARKELAEYLGIELNALRLRVNRIRVNLEKCINECIK